MDNVFELNDPFSYQIGDNGKIDAVQWFNGSQYIVINLDGTIETLLLLDNMQSHELRQLMIMWLALKYPDTLNYDENEKEKLIQESSELES